MGVYLLKYNSYTNDSYTIRQPIERAFKKYMTLRFSFFYYRVIRLFLLSQIHDPPRTHINLYHTHIHLHIRRQPSLCLSFWYLKLWFQSYGQADMIIFVFTHPPVFVKLNAPLVKIPFVSYSSRFIARMKELVELNNNMQAVSLYDAWLRFYGQYWLFEFMSIF